MRAVITAAITANAIGSTISLNIPVAALISEIVYFIVFILDGLPECEDGGMFDKVLV